MTKEQFDDLHDLMSNYLIGHENRNHPADVISRMFRLHNLEFPTEYGQSCSGCRARVYQRLKEYYYGHKEKWGY